MSNATLMFLSIRKFFGTLVPGLAWVLLLYVLFHGDLDAKIKEFAAFQDKVLLYAAILLIGYLVGSLNIEFSFRTLEAFGDGVDRLVSRARSSWLRSFFRILSERLHIFWLETRQQHLATRRSALIPAHQEVDELPVVTEWKTKMQVLSTSPGMAKTLLEIEGEINFFAGMFPPVLVFGIWLLVEGWTAGLLVLLVALWFALRFQHLRHDEIDNIHWAYLVHQAILKEESRHPKPSDV